MTQVELERAASLELRRRDSGFMAIIEADPATGVGHYQASGKAKRFTFHVTDGVFVLDTPDFAKPENAVTAAEAPDPYAPHLTQLRAASGTPSSTFEDAYKAARLRALESEQAELAAHIEAHPYSRLTAAEAAECEPPNIYAEGIKALQAADERRRLAKENG